MHVLTCNPPGASTSTIRIGAGPAELLGELGRSAFLLADAGVIERRPDVADAATHRLDLPGGEAIKSMATLERVLREMTRCNLDRRGRLVALGGGTIGDLGGLAAALYKRGIELVQVPTTLLAMLDSSVGGKTAINLPEGKNLVGHLWPAARVLIDPSFLTTLEEEEFASGLGEALKMAIGLEPDLFALLERQHEAVRARDPLVLEQVIVHAVRAKIRVVEEDPHERGARRLLNLGHTLGHALEAHSGGKLRHGHAVARGIYFAIDAAEKRELLPNEQATRCRGLLQTYGFAETPIPPMRSLMEFLQRDKKVEGEDLHLVLPCAVGHSRTVRVPLAELAAEHD